ncbi:MAG: hypothetical protein IKN64_11305 [Desulfovibrio sp.]|nr:hypothetical protein [Desulfovibrio sp.]
MADEILFSNALEDKLFDIRSKLTLALNGIRSHLETPKDEKLLNGVALIVEDVCRELGNTLENGKLAS